MINHALFGDHHLPLRRSHLLIVAVALVFGAAVGLRIRSHLARPNRSPSGGRPATTRPASISEPWDYVAHPWVSPDERERGPTRIISLAPSITEIVCAQGR